MPFEIKVIDGLIKVFGKIESLASGAVHQLKFLKYEYIFEERDDDIYVATYLKSGTTWVQMILYQLTTTGEINFGHLYDVSPWLRNLAEKGGEIPNLPSPRIIKTHDPYRFISRFKKGRFIYVIRDGRDVAVSLFHHEKNYNNRALTFTENFESYFIKPGDMNWFEFNRQWLQNKKKLTMLVVRYEDLHNNFVPELYRIADFIGVKIKEDDLPRIIERCSFSFMKQHETKFGEQPPAIKHQPVYDQFIRNGKTGEGIASLSAEQLQFFNTMFQLNLSEFSAMESYRNQLGNAEKDWHQNE
ncbi:MAG TPA: sulfotransferase domain-containing protein [Chitinophagales bacterium]|nr:sulfotransferase domain-containing protein [Chitinophagales bacterium]